MTQTSAAVKVELKASNSKEKLPLFRKDHNLLTHIQACKDDLTERGYTFITAKDIMQQIVDNQVGFNLVEFCHQAGITVHQLREFIQNNPQELGLQHNPSLQRLPHTHSREVTLSSAGATLVLRNGKAYPLCASCKSRAYAELPVCPVCGATLELNETAQALVRAASACNGRATKVVVDDGDVYVTEDDVARAEQDLQMYKRML